MLVINGMHSKDVSYMKQVHVRVYFYDFSDDRGFEHIQYVQISSALNIYIHKILVAFKI